VRDGHSSLAERTSPVHDALSHLSPRWGRVCHMPVALAFATDGSESAQAANLGLADVSALPRLTVKGPTAAAWLHDHNVTAPSSVYDSAQLPGGGQVIRTGLEEIFIEDSVQGSILPRLEEKLRAVPTGGPYEVIRQDAAFLLSGSKAAQVLAQTCGVDFRQPDGRLVYSRVAGVSAAIRYRADLTVPAFQLWIDPSFGPYLWETLLEIVTDLGGKPVGLCCFWQQLS
jgi:sarcosine oxidase, subunit gamma